MNKIGVMQGRLLPKLNNQYQAHPTNYWQDEFSISAEMGLDCIEFILDFDSCRENPLIKNDGIHYVEMKHKNNVQTSIEEFEVVRDLMKEMIGSEFDDNGSKRKLTVEDFLIISPYNTQVNLLISKLEEAKIKNPRVGTIDKFQGQEAPVTIISMTSSDSDSLPRNKEFFFSILSWMDNRTIKKSSEELKKRHDKLRRQTSGKRSQTNIKG